MPEAKYTTIKVRHETRDRLADFGKKSETYDNIVIRLLNEVEEVRKSRLLAD